MFRVIQSSSKKTLNERDTIFYLRQDNWNDYGFQTQYHLYLSGAHTDDGEPISIGNVKILKKGQRSSDYHQLKTGDFENLGNEYCSLGQSLDYYERIANIKPNFKDYLFSALNDVIINKKIMEEFIFEEGWKTSIMRYIDSRDDIFTLAPIMINKDYQKLPSIELSFKFNNESLIDPIEFNFDSPEYDYISKLPNRIITLVGRNGSGKSTLLAKISRVAYASGVDRNDPALIKIGKFEPAGLGFPKIINISYSAFDSFQIPGIYIKEKQQILKDMMEMKGRYIFCGIRDICKELETSINEIKTDTRGKLTENEILKDRQSFTNLKSIEQLQIEVDVLLDKIVTSKRDNLLCKVLKILSKESSFRALLENIDEKEKNKSLISIFMNSSTGHKFVIHSIVNIIAHSNKRSLILFDEPETHLHPPLLAVLMSSIRYILNELDSFAIVATHSPVVVQETLSRHVKIIRRSNELTKILSPEIQTFGENISAITSHVFSLSSDITEFHYVLDNVMEEYTSSNKYDDNEVLEEIEKLFDGSLSSQARAYTMSYLASKRP